MTANELKASRCRGWCRIDLAGGTLDIWPLGLMHPGARTVNVAVGVPVEVGLDLDSDHYTVVQGDSQIRVSTPDELYDQPNGALFGHLADAVDLPPCRMVIASGSPPGAGLGGSSALGSVFVAASDAVLGRPSRSPQEVATLVCDVEARLMSLPTGRQDHYPTLVGGALEIVYVPGGEQVRRMAVDLDALGKCLTVAYTGKSHFSAGNNWQVVRSRLDGGLVTTFDGIVGVAKTMVLALEAGDLPSVGEGLSREWMLRRTLAPEVSSEGIERFLAVAIEKGAWGGKATGAGGGGCVAILSPPEKKPSVEEALREAGAQLLHAPPVAEPQTVQGLPRL